MMIGYTALGARTLQGLYKDLKIECNTQSTIITYEYYSAMCDDVIHKCMMM